MQPYVDALATDESTSVLVVDSKDENGLRGVLEKCDFVLLHFSAESSRNDCEDPSAWLRDICLPFSKTTIVSPGP